MINIDFKDRIKSRLFFNHPLSRFTSWRVGGPGEVVLIPENVDDLSLALKLCSFETPVTWLGLGSNVLIRDEGIRGLVIVTQGSFLDEITIQSNMIYAQAGVSCGQLARFSARHHLSGIEFLAGIPGTVGGALRMNAGCYGGEIWNYVSQVETIDRRGMRRIRSKNEFIVSYREVILPGVEYFFGAYFLLEAGNKETSLEKIKAMLEQRHQSQPINLPSCGSVFKNPPGNYAAKLIEQCGLKAYRIGGAQISEKHANFIVNTDAASSQNIIDLIELAKQKVKEKFNIELKQELKIL